MKCLSLQFRYFRFTYLPNSSLLFKLELLWQSFVHRPSIKAMNDVHDIHIPQALPKPSEYSLGQKGISPKSRLRRERD